MHEGKKEIPNERTNERTKEINNGRASERKKETKKERTEGSNNNYITKERTNELTK